MATKTAALNDEQRRFLEEPYAGAATTLRADGSPHTTVVWVDVEDGTVMFNTAVGRAKERHLRRDPRVAILVVDPQNTYRWLSVSGRAELTDIRESRASRPWSARTIRRSGRCP